MITYFNQFTNLAWAWGYQSQRNRLGHNTRLVALDGKRWRVYFSAGPVKINGATDVKDV